MIEQLLTEHLDTWTQAVETKSAAGRGSSKKLKLHGIAKLRELILELAVRGQLVPQDESDEPASVLLERIAVERERLVKEKKIKKPKVLSEISEKPFELPKSWGWIRFGNMSHLITDGAHHTPTYIDEGVPFLSVKDMSSGVLDFSKTRFISEEQHGDLSKRCKPEKGDLLLTKVGTTGIPILIDTDIEFSIFVSVALIKFPTDKVNGDYLSLLIKSPLVKKQSEEGTEGVGNKNLVLRKINAFIMAIPPLEEQGRIAAKVDELMALCDALEREQESSIAAHELLVENLLAALTNAADKGEFKQAWARVAEHFDTLFTTERSVDQLKQTILQLAVMGKLVEQDPTDEPAGVLLERIAAEKARLVKEKKIKKQKVLPEIGEEEKVFELPVGWEWCRFEDIVDITSGITKGRKLANRKTMLVPYLRVANVQRSFLDLSEIKEVEIPVEERDKYKVENGDLLITEGGDWDKVGRTAIWGGETPYIAHQNHVFKARALLEEQDVTWLEQYLNSAWARDYFAGSSKQTTNLASINKTQLRGCLVAIPPLQEQERIVKRVEQLMQLCEQLREKVVQAQEKNVQIANALALVAVA